LSVLSEFRIREASVLFTELSLVNKIFLFFYH